MVFLFIRLKGTSVGTKFAVIGSSLVVAYEEIKMFALLPQVTTLGF